mmetsp:Transcript_6629/g.10726  ORF Transcript_6629/g.10726 Transcript_6629/m.10726 type:complete len:116 (-) Transcript_6629:322-669(-)
MVFLFLLNSSVHFSNNSGMGPFLANPFSTEDWAGCMHDHKLFSQSLMYYWMRSGTVVPAAISAGFWFLYRPKVFLFQTFFVGGILFLGAKHYFFGYSTASWNIFVEYSTPPKKYI